MRTAKGGLSHGMLSALVSVERNGPLRLADLAQIELISAPSVTRVVAELEFQSLVSRTADPEDGRASLIEVTDAGQQALVLAKVAREEIMSELLGSLDEAGIASITAALPAFERMVQFPGIQP